MTDFRALYKREREGSVPSKQTRHALRSVAHSCVLECMQTDLMLLTTQLLKNHTCLRHARLSPQMLSVPLMLSRFGDMRTAVREDLVNRFIEADVLNRTHASTAVTSAEPVISLHMTLRAPPSRALFSRLSKVMTHLTEHVNWECLDRTLNIRTSAVMQNIKTVVHGTSPALPSKVWYNFIKTKNVICHNFVDPQGREYDRFVFDVVTDVHNPHMRMELARAIDTSHQYVLQVKIPVFVHGSDGSVTTASVTLLHLDMVLPDDPEYPLLSNAKYHRTYLFPHSKTRLPSYSFRGFMHASLLVSLIPDTSANLSRAAVFFVLAYLYEEDDAVTLVDKLRQLDSVSPGGNAHELFQVFRNAVSNATRTLSARTREKFLHQLSLAFHMTISAFMASHVMTFPRKVSFVTPQSMEDSHF